MKNKKIAIIAILVIMISFLFSNKSFAKVLKSNAGGFNITIYTNRDATYNFEKNGAQDWACALQYAMIHQISYVNGDTKATLAEWETEVIKITKELKDSNYNFPELTEEQKNYVDENRNNMKYAEQYLKIEHEDKFDFNTWANAIDNNNAFYDFEVEQKNKEQQEETEKHTLSEIINNADNFLKNGNEEDAISNDNMKKMSDTLYNILFIIGTILAFIIGGILGIKFMTSGLEGKAEVKAMLMPYVIGCIVLFGSFTIWKLVVTILKTI